VAVSFARPDGRMGSKEIPEGYEDGDIHEFLPELSELSRKYGKYIGSSHGVGLKKSGNNSLFA